MIVSNRGERDSGDKQKRPRSTPWTRREKCSIFFLLGAPLSVGAFVTPSSPSTSVRINNIARVVSIGGTAEQRLQPCTTLSSPFHRLPSGSRLDESTGGDIVPFNDNSLLTSAFSALDDRDKYDTVLTGLCAKVIDGSSSGDEEEARMGMKDPIQIMGEMNASRIVAGQRSIMALIDATVLTSDARIMAKVLSLSIKNGAISTFGDLQAVVTPFPRSSPSGNMFQFGNKNKELIERLNNLPSVPDDDRAAEVTSAASFSAIVMACFGVNAIGGWFGLEELAPYTNLFLGLMVTTVVIDNFFDVIVGGGSMIAKMNEDKLPEGAKKINAPKKEEMPLGLGSGSMTGTVVRGLGRLLSANTERDCQCEAAAIFTAYSLGLPCFAFRPNALEGAALVLESMSGGESEIESENSEIYGELDNLSSDAGLLKVLIWLMAPVAMENGKHSVLISSDPRESDGFLRRLREKSDEMEWAQKELAGVLPEDDEQAASYIRWALAEADILLRDNNRIVEQLAEALAGGAATVGDCVAILESW